MKNNYDGEVRSLDNNKIAINKLIEEFGKIDRRNKDDAIILDSESLLTRNHLTNAGFKKSSIHIPNFDRKIYDCIKPNHRKSYHMMLHKFLKEYKRREKVSIAFFDYCCTLKGNPDGIKPSNDISLYFKKHIPRDKSILGVTISIRTGKGNTTMPMGTSIIELNSCIEKQAHMNGYVAVNIPGGRGYNGMFVNFYKIFKQ